MKFGIFYEHQLPRPWDEGSELKLIQDALEQVEGGDALGDAGRRVEVEWQLDDAVAESDVLGDLAARSEEDLGGTAVRVLLEEVVLDLPHVVDAEGVGELDLLQRVLDQLLLAALLPRAGVLVLVEDPELHAATSRSGDARDS